MSGEFENEVMIPVGDLTLEGELTVPSSFNEDDSATRGIILFAHGSGSSRLSARNLVVARALHQAGFATLLFNLLTREEQAIDAFTSHLRYDIALLAERLLGATEWIVKVDRLRGASLGYFGSSTGGGAALIAAAREGGGVKGIVTRSGRPDLASGWLKKVAAPTLFIVGELDFTVVDLTRAAMDEMRCRTEMVSIPAATHLFEEPGALNEAAQLATHWFRDVLSPSGEISARVAAGQGEA